MPKSSGSQPEDKGKVPGSKKVYRDVTKDDTDQPEPKICKACKGKGKVDGDTCGRCNGTGVR
jgi:DnaJ-class molecular chaperone